MSSFELGRLHDTVQVVWHGDGISAEALPGVTPDGRVRFVDMLVKKDEDGKWLTSDDLRAIPFTGMLTWANTPGPRRSIMRAAGWDDAKIDRLYDRPALAFPSDPARPSKPPLRFNMPEGRRKPDAFYERVARAYMWLSTWGGSRRPAAQIAEVNQVPATTVHRWIKEARRRGLLPPGEIGRAGA
jgi:hypothetical protein